MRLKIHWLLSFLVVGCAATQARQPEPQPTLASRHLALRRVALIELEDATRRADLGTHKAIKTQLETGLKDRMVLVGPISRPQAISPNWFRQQSQELDVQGFVSGKITGFRLQGTKRRVWVSLTMRLLDSNGQILWSKSPVGLTDVLDDQPLDRLYYAAAQRATKEFTDDLTAQQLDGSGIAHR
jgi:hypothetical protein